MRAFSSVLSLAVPVARARAADLGHRERWQTTWDRSKLFTSLAPSTPINFVSPSVIGSADIDVDDTATFQSVWGFGGTLTDSSALILSNMKATNSANYFKLLNYMFSPNRRCQFSWIKVRVISSLRGTTNNSAFSYIRVPLGASDFSAKLYSFDDTSGDTSFNSFNIARAPSYLYTVLKDIQSVNSVLRVHILALVAAWMDENNRHHGWRLAFFPISFQSTRITSSSACKVSNLRASRRCTRFQSRTNQRTRRRQYPTASMTVAVHAQVGIALRALMNSNGFSTVKLIGYEHNWDDAGAYPIQLMEAAPNAFDGVAFHCYAGTVSQQDTFHAAYPTKEIYTTECSGTIGSDWWSDIKWYMDNLFIGGVTHNSHAVLMWNIALDSGTPKLPGTTSCGGAGCRSIAQVNLDGSYSLNQEFYAMAQASKAIIPKDVGGAWGKRIGVTVGGSLNWALIVGAYVTTRVKSTDWLRYSLVVLNWDDSVGGWNPTPVEATIEFRGMQATYTFPVGVTTLWWYAPPTSFKNADQRRGHRRSIRRLTANSNHSV
ncbi:glycoside hydrolase [Mycena alexandri]|uniref:Glycoside hydrolase n=1 Tax=Mycena alexandri TaxID=1745969 RepID=A0AAD6T8K3_9AGAR|nr:glycoside hydrolase [Mycena alexandri]